MRALEIITGHVIYNPAYNYKFQLNTTILPTIIISTYAYCQKTGIVSK